MESLYFIATTAATGISIALIVVVAAHWLLIEKFTPIRKDEAAHADGRKTNAPTRNNTNASSLLRKQSTSAHNVKTSVQVVVLGDIGRSPRMQYHALSLQKHGASVDLIGLNESDIHPELLSSTRVRIVPLQPPPPCLQTSNKLLFVLFGPLKVILQACNLYHVLAFRTKPAEWLLLQNPPSIPVLAVAWITSVLRNTKMVIDWHNFGWSVLALKLGSSHPLVFVARLYDLLFCRRAYAHFTVTHAMARYLQSAFGINSMALHDRPAEDFKPLDSEARLSFLKGLSETAQFASNIHDGSWRLVVSSTSWSADEDFSIFLDALVAYSSRAAADKDLPNILAIITGKGPEKEFYLEKIRQLNQEKKLSSVIILTAWLTRDDYVSLLGAADLGVSLHQSTSGVDLPMKVVDMFGAGLPVVGWCAYESWPELVKEDINGKGFKTAQDLEDLLVQLFQDSGAALDSLKRGAAQEGLHRWDDEWNQVAGKLFGT